MTAEEPAELCPPQEPPQDSETTGASPEPTKPRRDPYAEFDEGALAVETLKKTYAERKKRGLIPPGSPPPPPEQFTGVVSTCTEDRMAGDPALMTIAHADGKDRIAQLLHHLTEGGGSHNFVIFEVGPCRYVQLATSCGSAVMYGEASSGRYCAQGCACSPTAAERARLLRLGWRPPTKRKFLNFYRYWPFITPADRQAIAEVAVATLDIFGWHGEPLKTKLHLDW